ncbi:hypothetical protein E4T39_04314 [Aureobasidium subglaciale]|nr:hypothetical protein E4T39_04314 [Aureobasidium subglaciale]
MDPTMLSDRSVTGHVTQSISSPSNQAKEPAQEEGARHDDSNLSQQTDASCSDPTTVAQQISDTREPSYTRQEATTTQIRQVPENSTIATLKHGHSSRTQSPLRESSVPVPSTEIPGPITTPAPAPPKRSHHKKKGVAAAATTKRSAAGPAKRSHKKKIVASTAATPAQSSPAPRSVRAVSSPARSSPDVDGNGDQQFSGDEGEEEDGGSISDDELYCICKRPDTGSFMIGCDGGCDDWFHGGCVNISEKWKTLIDKYICKSCTDKGRGETTWKRMCRRSTCGMPAVVSKGTKYCSDRCGLLFMQEMISERTRKSSETTSRAKKGQQTTNEDLGARGGIISAGELKALFLTAPTLEGLKSLGDGSLSPITASSPTANTTKQDPEDTSLSHESALNDIERERITQLTHLKSTARARHSLLKDRAKFVAMLKTVASRLADHRNLKPKDLCGFDSRLTWGEDEFDAWRASPAGKEALNIGSLPLPDEDADMDASTNGTQAQETCTKKKCLKHHDWAKLQIEDTRFEITQNADVMRVLEKEEREIIERARLRAREIKAGGVGGTVEFHDLTPPGENQEDKEMGVEAVIVAEGVVEDAGDVDMEGGQVKVETSEVKVEAVEESEKEVEGQQDDDEDKEVDMLDAIEATI